MATKSHHYRNLEYDQIGYSKNSGCDATRKMMEAFGLILCVETKP